MLGLTRTNEILIHRTFINVTKAISLTFTRLGERIG